MRDELRLTVTLVFGLALILGSCRDQPPVAPNNTTEATTLTSQSGPVYYKTVVNSLDAAYHGYIQRLYPYCDDSDSDFSHYSLVDSCQADEDIVFRVYESGGPLIRCGMSNPIFDFDTRYLPDDAVIEQGVTLKVWYSRSLNSINVSTPPDPACDQPPPSGGSSPPPLNIGSEFAALPSTVTQGGELIEDPHWSVVDLMNTGSHLGIIQVQQGFSNPGRWIEIRLNAAVSCTSFSRYSWDNDTPLPDNDDEYRKYFFKTGPGKVPKLEFTYHTPFEFYGAALGGARWEAFGDTLLAADLVSSASYEALTETLSVYLVWENTDSGGLQELSPPVQLDSTTWWGTPGFTAADFTVTVSYDSLDQEYHSCAAGEGPEAVLNSDGTLALTDLNFGGIGSKIRIELRAPDPNPKNSFVRLIVLQLDKPGTYVDAALGPLNAAPNSSYAGIVTIEENIVDPVAGTVSLRLPTRIVEWVSADISGVVPIRKVDAADLAALSVEMGNPVVWGFGTDTPNFQVNVNMFGSSADFIDASDLALWASDSGDDCTTAKLASSDKEKMLAWFGIAATGEMVQVGPAGEMVPGYEIIDWVKNRLAIANPHGWLQQP